LRKLSSPGGPDRFGIELSASRQLAWDTNIQKVIEHVSVGLAEHFRDSLLAGERADGRGRLPAKRSNLGPPWVGVRTGYMAKNMVLSSIRGGEQAGERTIAPNDHDPKRAEALKAMAAKDVQVVTGQGRAGAVLKKLLHEAAEAGLGELTTPARARRSGGLLPQVK
jgi:hypothetical protein